jgi:hypothetical protein
MGFYSPGNFPHNQVLPARRWRITLLAFLQRILDINEGMRGAWHLQTSQPAAQTFGRLQGIAPVVNPYRGRTVTSRTQRPIPS